MTENDSHRRWGAWSWILTALYVILIAAPAAVVFIVPLRDRHEVLAEFGRAAALVAVGLLAGQPILAARLRGWDRLIGLDTVYMVHRIMGMLAFLLLVCHPILLAGAHDHWELVTSLQQPWYILVGKGALLALAVLVVTAVLYQQLHMPFHRWRQVHNVLAVAVIVALCVHAYFTGTDLQFWPVQLVFAAVVVAGASAYIAHTVVGPLLRHSKPFRVADVSPENAAVCTVRFDPPEGGRLDHLPGQFQFLTFFDSEGVPQEEHPFTISSSPYEGSSHSATIKNVGDFTAKIPDASVGDRVAIQGPFGRFSYVLHPHEDRLVFIAGGIGITPLMSMLRHMRDSGTEKNVLLLYGNDTEADIVFRDELDAMAKGSAPKLKVVYVLVEPGDSWSGERGYIDAEMIGRYVDDLAAPGYYICGPPPMMTKLIGDLTAHGVKSADIHNERFAL